uniref:Uncharacterized protein n=1 Tax=viral metagenome TaxID=1070528 RepID=A0A6C0L9S1_9ZZZZ
MSSIQSQFAQIPNSVRLLYVVTGGNAFSKSTLLTYLAANKSLIYGFDGTVLNAKNGNTLLTSIFNAQSPTIPVSPGNIYRDMGKKLYLQTNGVLQDIFTYCQLVQGPNTEGVPNDYSTNGNVYICTWTNDTDSGQTALVARSG